MRDPGCTHAGARAVVKSVKEGTGRLYDHKLLLLLGKGS